MTDESLLDDRYMKVVIESKPDLVAIKKAIKEAEKKGETVSFPSYKALQWLYLVTLDGRALPTDVMQANSYLLELLKKDIKRQSIYDKALSAVIFSKTDAQRAQEYAQSLKEYTVFREDMGRYYDTPRAAYSGVGYSYQQCECCICIPEGTGVPTGTEPEDANYQPGC